MLPTDDASVRACCPDRWPLPQSVAAGACHASWAVAGGSSVASSGGGFRARTSWGLPAARGPTRLCRRPARRAGVDPRLRLTTGRGKAGGRAAARAARTASPNPPSEHHMHGTYTCTRPGPGSSPGYRGSLRPIAAPIRPVPSYARCGRFRPVPAGSGRFRPAPASPPRWPAQLGAADGARLSLGSTRSLQSWCRSGKGPASPGRYRSATACMIARVRRPACDVATDRPRGVWVWVSRLSPTGSAAPRPASYGQRTSD